MYENEVEDLKLFARRNPLKFRGIWDQIKLRGDNVLCFLKTS